MGRSSMPIGPGIRASQAATASGSWKAPFRRHGTICRSSLAMGASSLAQIFTVPPTPAGGTPADLLAFLRGFDIPAQAGLIDAT